MGDERKNVHSPVRNVYAALQHFSDRAKVRQNRGGNMFDFEQAILEVRRVRERAEATCPLGFDRPGPKVPWRSSALLDF